jgi:type IV pilus assembly protein PilE
MMIAVSVAGILGSLAYPSFESQVQRGRRAEALAALLTVQLTQSRWHANTGRYGSLADLGVAPRTGSGHYTLITSDVSADGYRLVAVANGPAARDAACRELRLQVNGLDVQQTSGPDAATVNPAPINRRCWGA